MSEFMVKAEGVHKRFGRLEVLRGISLQVPLGSVMCVIGPSVDNVAAIRAYEKAGFRPLKEVRVPGEAQPEFLMRLTSADLGSLQR